MRLVSGASWPYNSTSSVQNLSSVLIPSSEQENVDVGTTLPAERKEPEGCGSSTAWRKVREPNSAVHETAFRSLQQEIAKNDQCGVKRDLLQTPQADAPREDGTEFVPERGFAQSRVRDGDLNVLSSGERRDLASEEDIEEFRNVVHLGERQLLKVLLRVELGDEIFRLGQVARYHPVVDSRSRRERVESAGSRR